MASERAGSTCSGKARRGPLPGGTADALAPLPRGDARPKIQEDHVPEHRRGATTGSRHASLRGDRDRISCGSRT